MTNKPIEGSIALGFMTSFGVALVVGILGGAFEALFLGPVVHFITFTLGPDLVFVLLNGWFLMRETKPRTETGLRIGFACLLVTVVTSFCVYIAIVFDAFR